MSLFNDTINRLSQTTYLEGFRKCNKTIQDNDLRSMLQYVLDKQKLTQKKMDGFSTSKLPLVTELEVRGDSGELLSYVSIFNKVVKEHKDDWTIVDLIVEVCKYVLSHPDDVIKAHNRCKEECTMLDFATGLCGRIIRALPSYLREYQLEEMLKENFQGAEFIMSEEMDMMNHADVYFKKDGIDYYVWSFVNTPKSVGNFIDKFSGRRGQLKNGLHLVCPFIMDDPQYTKQTHGWFLYGDLYGEKISELVGENEPLQYSLSESNFHFDPQKNTFNNYNAFNRPMLVKKNEGDSFRQINSKLIV